MNGDNIVKICDIHGNLTINEVYSDKNVKRYRCKNCNKIKSLEYRENNKDKTKKYSKKYYEYNKEKSLTRSAKRYEKKGDLIKKQRESFRNNNKDKIKSQSKNYTKKITDNLSDAYITKVLSNQFKCKRSEVPKGLIDLKRTLLLIKSEIRMQENKSKEIDLRRKLREIKNY